MTGIDVKQTFTQLVSMPPIATSPGTSILLCSTNLSIIDLAVVRNIALDAALAFLEVINSSYFATMLGIRLLISRIISAATVGSILV